MLYYTAVKYMRKKVKPNGALVLKCKISINN